MMESTGQGRYLYCITDTGEGLSLGAIGLEGQEVYTIPYQDICAVVHDCPTKPCKVEDHERLQGWVMAHQKVVEAAWERWGAVLPSALGTVIKGEERSSAEECLGRWLESNYERLQERMAKVRGKAEYGIQVFWDLRARARVMAEAQRKIHLLEGGMPTSSRGLAYMYRQRLESLLKKEMEAQADQCFRECYSYIKRQVDDICIEKVKRSEAGVQMVLNLSCLVAPDKYARLGEELERIDRMEGLSVRFTGPWPPYSFVG